MLDPFLQVAGRAHPMLLHLPIGMLVALIALEFLALIRLIDLSARARIALAWLVFLSAAISIASGLLLEREPAYTGGETLDLHKWIGIGFGILAMLTAVSASAPRLRKAYPLLLLLATAAMFPAGHLGATMTHGEGFLTEPLLTRAASPLRSGEGSTLPTAARGTYTDKIAPIFDKYCISCHGDSKRKGKLALHTPGSILAGGSSGSAIEPGDPENSEILYRMRLPHGDRDRMPPKDKPQPSDAEILAIENWIADGADFDEGATHPAASPGADSSPATPPRPAPQPPHESIIAIRAHQAHIEIIDPQTGMVWVSFDAAPGTTDADAARLLAPLADHIAELSLAGTRITDASLPLIASMANLQRLSLARTACSSAGLAALPSLGQLEELNLTETPIDDAAAAILGLPDRFPALTTVYLWRSKVGDDALRSLQDARPNLRIIADAPPADPIESEPPIAFTSDAPPPATPAAADFRPINDACPVAGKPIDPRFALVHQGRVVGFCCQKCLNDFLAEPDRYPVSPRRQ